MSVDHQCRKSIGFGLFFLSVYLSSWKFDMFWSGLFITVSIEDTYFYTKTALCVLDYSMHSKSSLFKTLKTSSCRIHKASKDSKKKIFLVDSAKKEAWFIIVVSMVAGMIRELSIYFAKSIVRSTTKENNRGRKKKRVSFMMIYHLAKIFLTFSFSSARSWF